MAAFVDVGLGSGSLASRSRAPARVSCPRRAPATSSTAAGEPSATAKRVLVPVADGSEEIETVTIVDTLVRAGAEVTMASVGPALNVRGSRGVKLVADTQIEECLGLEWDAVVLPGGMPGAENLRDSAALKTILEVQNERYARIGAICAAPAVVLAAHAILDGKEATCYPAEQFLDCLSNAKLIDDDDCPVVVDGNLTTSRGPGTALVFSLNLVEQLFGKAKADGLAAVMLLDADASWSYNSSA